MRPTCSPDLHALTTCSPAPRCSKVAKKNVDSDASNAATSIAASDEDERLWPATSASAYPPARSARALHELEAMTMEAQLAHVLAPPS